jgi:4-phytase/acid phosphatase
LFDQDQALRIFKFAIIALALAAPAFAQTEPLYHLEQTIPLGGGIKWDYLHFDAPSNRLYISHGDEVTVVDAAAGNIIGQLANLPGSHGIAVDPATGLVYADSADNSVVEAFDPKTLQPVASAKVLLDADGVSYDPFSRQIFVSGGDGDGLTPVSTITGKSAATIALGSSPEFHVADGAGSLYVALVDANQIARIDTKTDRIIARWPVAPCAHPKGMAIDPATRRVFASCASGVAVVLDADSGKLVATLPIGKGNDAAAFDPARERFFASNGDGTLTVVAENGPDDFKVLANMPAAPGARTMALDPATGRVFLVTATVTKTIPPATPADHPHYEFAPGSLKLLVFAPPALQTESVVLLMRHGVRPPTHEPALDPAIAPDPWPVWEVADGYLTPHGAQAIALLAAYDRGIFAAAGVLPATGCPAPGSVTVYADVDERTVKTAESFATALAPGCAIPVGHAATESDPLFSALDSPPQNFDAKRAKAAMIFSAAIDIKNPVAAQPALFQQMQDVLDPHGHAFLTLPSKLSAKTPGHAPKLSGPIAEGATAGEDFLLEYLDNKPMAQVGWGRVRVQDVATLLAFHPLEYTITARAPYIADIAAAPLARRMEAGLTGPEKLTVLVGHDTNIADLGGMLGLHWSLGGYPADDPPPGGGILFSRLRDPATGAQYVTAAYQVQTMAQIRNLTPLDPANPPAIQPLPIPGCGDSVAQTACTLSAFKTLVASKLAAN